MDEGKPYDSPKALSILKGLTEAGSEARRHWYAVYTAPKHEKSALLHLQTRIIDCFLPTFERERQWRNRQRIKTVLPLFPGYLFVHIGNAERAKVLSTPGVVRIVGGTRTAVPVPEATIEFLRSDMCRKSIEPYHDLAFGQRVRIKAGPLRHVEGVLVRKSNAYRFVISIEMINQRASVEVRAEDLEPLAA